MVIILCVLHFTAVVTGWVLGEKMREQRVHDWDIRAGFGWDSRCWVCSTVSYGSRSSFNVIKATPVITFIQTHSHTSAPQAVWSPTRSTKRISSGARGRGGRTVSWGRCKRIYGIEGENSQNAKHTRPSHRQTHGRKEQRMSEQMKWTGEKMRGQHQEKAENTRNMQPGSWTDGSDGTISHIRGLGSCIVLHSVSVQVCEKKLSQALVLCDKREKV